MSPLVQQRRCLGAHEHDPLVLPHEPGERLLLVIAQPFMVALAMSCLGFGIGLHVVGRRLLGRLQE